MTNMEKLFKKEGEKVRNIFIKNAEHIKTHLPINRIKMTEEVYYQSYHDLFTGRLSQEESELRLAGWIKQVGRLAAQIEIVSDKTGETMFVHPGPFKPIDTRTDNRISWSMFGEELEAAMKITPFHVAACTDDFFEQLIELYKNDPSNDDILYKITEYFETRYNVNSDVDNSNEEQQWNRVETQEYDFTNTTSNIDFSDFD